MKQPLFETEILIKPRDGIVLQTVYYSDGTVEEIEVPTGKIIQPDYIII